MIQSFKHKGLRELFEKGKSKHIASDFAPKLSADRRGKSSRRSRTTQLSRLRFALAKRRTRRDVDDEDQQKLATYF
jgi:plasmid maintenance system killer protein